MERSVASRANANIVITPDFSRILANWGVSAEKISVLENWAPLDEVRSLPSGQRMEQWPRPRFVVTVFLYSGTLGMKQPSGPALRSGKIGRPQLHRRHHQRRAQCRRPHLETLPKPCPISCCSIISRTSGYLRFSPARTFWWQRSKRMPASSPLFPPRFWSYLCAGRPVLLAARETPIWRPGLSSAARPASVVDPDSPENWALAAQRSCLRPSSCAVSLGANARRYAERGVRYCATLPHDSKPFSDGLPMRQRLSFDATGCGRRLLIVPLNKHVEPTPGAEFRI